MRDIIAVLIMAALVGLTFAFIELCERVKT